MSLKENENRIKETFKTIFENINAISDSNTVIGKAIKTEGGNEIIPISKITTCILTGGGEYGKINIFKNSSDLPFSAGNGSIISVKPCGFLVKNGSSYNLLTLKDNTYENILEKLTDYIVKAGEKK